MYNEDFLQKVIYEHGVDQAIIFCQLESKKYQKTIESAVFSDPLDHLELQYERNWWADRAERLKNGEKC